MRRSIRAVLAAAATVPLMLGFAAPAALADSDRAAVGFGSLYHDGEVVRTVVTPTSTPGRGGDTIYAVSGGVDGQLAVTSVAPGEPGYHGGRWAVHAVSWNAGVEPYLLVSDEAVLAAAQAGEVSIMRVAAADFVCPVAGR